MTTSSTFKIEHNKPLPSGGSRGAKGKYPWTDLQVGDSFFAPGTKPSSLGSSAASWATRHRPDWRFTVRAEAGGARIWRIEDKPAAKAMSRAA